jgi:hypothetical protein
VSNPRIAALAAIMAELCLAAPTNPRRKFLMDRGWLPLGAEAFTGVEGWGKVIDEHAVTIPSSASDREQEFTLECTLQNIVTKWSDDILRWQDDGGVA